MDDILKKLNTLAANQGIPLNATFELTPRCNMHCKMCYIHRPECLPKQLPLRPMTFWLDMARQAKELGTMVLVITGGETFLYPEAETLLDQLMQMGFIISLNTNGTLLDHRRIAWLNEHPPAKINISLYGASDETYRRLCGIDDGFSFTSAAIDTLLSNGHNVYLNGTVTPENAADIPGMHEFASQRGLVLHNTSYLFPPGRYGIHRAPSRLAPTEAAQADLLLERLQLGPEAQLTKCAQQVRLVEATLRGEIAPAGGFHTGDGCSRSNCGGGRNSMAISWDGKLMPCVTNAGIQIPLDGLTLRQGWEQLKEQVNALKLPDRCIQCPLQVVCNACPATVFNEKGSFDQLSAYTCDYVREKYLARRALLIQSLEKQK